MSIDYGAYFLMENGQLPNRNPETGVRYGIIPFHECADWLASEMEPVSHQSCPECGEDMPEDFESPAPCPACGADIEDGEDWSEVYAWEYEKDGLALRLDDSGDLWVFESTVKTTGSHGSPCVPGAVTFGPEPREDGVECYGLPKEFLRTEEAP